MAQNDTATVAPLAECDLENAADGHFVALETLRAAVAAVHAELEMFGDDIAHTEVPHGHGDCSEPPVIVDAESYVCIYVSCDTLVRTTTQMPDVDFTDETAKAVAWAHNEFARRHGAAPTVLDAMDAAVLPRTDTIDEIITERR